ncbi:hypothetical protein BSLG_004886 [Batrachochytrium salamandrivorans]|nr:hypothetical protein BSLG_004886 [Batrachochytrium salamandrivorans]
MTDRSKGVYKESAIGGDTSSFSRTWDKAEYERRALLRQAGQLPSQKPSQQQQQALSADPAEDDKAGSSSLITARTADLGFTSAVGKTVIIQTSDGAQPGFHCDVCDRTYRDNMGFLDHINNLQAKGHIMRTARSTVEQVEARLLFHKLAKENNVTIDFKAERVKRQRKEEQDRIDKKELKKKRKEDSKKANSEAVDTNVDGDMAAMMGFGGFGSTKPS